MTQSEKERLLHGFDGLVKTTANQIVKAGVELEFDDICQLLRIKVWHAVEKFSAERAAAGSHLGHARDKRGRSPLERFVFMCVANMRKDIEKRPRRFNQSVEENRSRETLVTTDAVTEGGNHADWFDLRYLSVDEEDVYAAIFGDELELPSNLTRVERQLVMLRMQGRLWREIDPELGLSRAERERAMQAVREKLADWSPSAASRLVGPTPPLPHAVQRSAAARIPQAA